MQNLLENIDFALKKREVFAEGISIVVPFFNEEDNILPLTERIAKTMNNHSINYEIIFIDDHSTDYGARIIRSIRKLYPIKLYTKKGAKGKAQSIIEGTNYANYPNVAIIDADLQYEPEVIPEMFAKLNNGYDVVVGNRITHEEGKLRSLMSKTNNFIFNRVLHKFKVDVQSGLKVFKKEILKRMKLNPTPWTFDLEFLILARYGGYKIGSHKIHFKKRHSGRSKVNVIKSTLEIMFQSIELKFRDHKIIPFSERMKKNEGEGFHYKGEKFIHYSVLSEKKSAIKSVTVNQGLFIIILLLLFILGLFISWQTTIITGFGFLTLLYFSDIIFNLFLIFKSFLTKNEIQVTKSEIAKKKYSDWPVYTIFCPLYKEWQVIPQFIKAMSQLDYPKSKLQVILLLEENDKETLAKVSTFDLPNYFETVIVPHSNPKTKPKALNYGMKYMKGKYSVIYDAEDVPDPQQLKKAVIGFGKVDKSVTCLQAKLNFFNPQQNLLTRIFTLEYSLWFGLTLTGLQSLNAPIPLGGTSNHFRSKDLVRLKGWDAFNVTEDCDLGIRLFKEGYKTQILDSTTLEEANSNLINWIRQRSRWIKGYLQTYFVHMRQPLYFFKKNNEPHFLTFQLVVGGKTLTTLLNPLMWVITVVYFVFRPTVGSTIEMLFPGPIFYLATFSFVVGNFLYLYYYMIGAAKRKEYSLIKYAFIVPFYWLAMSVAGWIAVVGMIKNPHYWAKTVHGLHLNDKELLNKANKLINHKFAGINASVTS